MTIKPGSVPAMPRAPQTIHLSAFDWDGATHGFRNDGIEVDHDARDALYDILRSTASSHLEIIAPPGIINLGRASPTSCIVIQRSNVVLRGAGKNATRFTYGSTLVDIPAGRLNGCGIVVARFEAKRGHWTNLENITLRDFELEDLNPNRCTGDYKTTNSPNGIFAYAVDNIELLDLRVVNAKGNSLVTINGQTNHEGPVQHGCLVRNVDLLGDPGRPGKFVEGDGFNIGSYRDVKILQGSVIRVERHALEGGTPGHSMLVDGVLVDQQGQGFSGIAPTGYAEVRIVNCHIRNIAAPWYHIDFTDDPGANAPSMRSLIIQNNILERGTGEKRSIYPVRLQSIGFPSLLGNLDLSHNIIIGDFYYAVVLGSNDAPSGIVAHNDLSRMSHGNGGAMFNRISNTGPAPAKGDTLLVEGNRLPPGLPIFRFDNVPEWKNTGYLRLRGNLAGSTLAEASGGLSQHGHPAGVATNWINGTIPAGGLSEPYKVTVLDAMPGDRVNIYPAPNWPAGPAAEPIAFVTANDTVTCYVRNATAAPSPTLGGEHGFYIDIERR
ncbi:MAG: hypothetical protein V4475_18405 [Pseudomonadota bacterium]